MSHEPAHRQSRLTTVILILTACSVILMAVIAILGLPRIFSSADNSGAVRRGSDLQACRSSYASLVTEATSAANDLVLQGLAAVGRGDEAALEKLVTDPPGVQVAPIDSARAAVVRRTTAYASAVKLSRTDPARFLAQCGTVFDGHRIRSCREARHLGAAPLYRGDPGYSTALDRDGDGIACE